MADGFKVNSGYLLQNIRIKMGNGSYVEGSIGYQERGVRKIGSGSTQKNLAELLSWVTYHTWSSAFLTSEFSRKKAYQENPHDSRIKCNEELAQVPEPMQQGHNDTDEEYSVSQSSALLVDMQNIA